jgi:hypothetical protein
MIPVGATPFVDRHLVTSFQLECDSQQPRAPHGLPVRVGNPSSFIRAAILSTLDPERFQQIQRYGFALVIPVGLPPLAPALFGPLPYQRAAELEHDLRLLSRLGSLAELSTRVEIMLMKWKTNSWNGPGLAVVGFI